ncbi:MAG: carbamoyltransferase HypF [Planctomycetota bacterium]
MIHRRRIRVAGVVQGVGFRPFVWRLAHSEGLVGWVRNDAAGVVVEVQGDGESLHRFTDRLSSQSPKLCSVTDLLSTPIPIVPAETGFRIRDSQLETTPITRVPVDVCHCEDCLREVMDPLDRRHGYPLTNCTQCGPRFTLIQSMPYDRSRTTMAGFTMCEACRQEYSTPSDRRFHAQPIACRDCGPQVWMEGPEQQRIALSDEALKLTRQAIADGQIVAIKGIGGFHLACDATRPDAVAELRTRKRRGDKPLAVMVADLETARRIADVTAGEAMLLQSLQRPIVLLKSRRTVDVGNDFIGVLLTYSPLHALLVQPGDVWVMTSGNRADEPIARTNQEARCRLGQLADRFLMHDRWIEAACDDSVVRVVDNEMLPIRRSRGDTPLVVPLPKRSTKRTPPGAPEPAILAVGSELKATIGLGIGDQVILGPHLGDMANRETLEALSRSVDHLCGLYGVQPGLVVADGHPAYQSTAWARQYATEKNAQLTIVQHHHAHVASLMAEHSLPPDTTVLGVCFDGTGFGTDDTIWGGEWLIANATRYERFAHLTPFPLPGGDAAIKHPCRAALAALLRFGIDSRRLPCRAGVTDREFRLLETQLDRQVNCVATSSMGRLFDVVASILGVRQRIDYEAQAAMELESLASSVWDDCLLSEASWENERVFCDPSPPAGQPLQIDVQGLLGAMVNDLRDGISTCSIAMGFHLGIVETIVEVAQKARSGRGIGRVGLTGGVFQNVLLTRLARSALRQQGFDVLTHRLVPPNDAGLSLGQLMIASARDE